MGEKTKEQLQAEAKAQIERALHNLSTAGVSWDAMPAAGATLDQLRAVAAAASGRSAVEGMAKVVANLPPVTNSQAIDQARQIWGAFLAMAKTNGATPAVSAITPILKAYYRNLEKKHLTDYGMLKPLATVAALAHDPPAAERALAEILSNLEGMEKIPPGPVN